MVVLSSDFFESPLAMVADVALNPDTNEEGNATEHINESFVEENLMGKRDFEMNETHNWVGHD